MRKIILTICSMILLLFVIILGAHILPSIGFEFEKEENEEEERILDIRYQTDGIYNGYMKMDNNYTPFQQIEEIELSQEEIQESIEVLEHNTFIKVEKNEEEQEIISDLGNEGGLVYKSIKLNQNNFNEILGEDGKIEILNEERDILATIDKEVQVEENGIITIVLEEDLETLILRTSAVQKEGILLLEYTKELRSSLIDMANMKVKTTSQLTTSNPEKNKTTENILEIQEAKSNVELNVDDLEWTNEQQNEVNFNILLNANQPKDNLWKNPSFTIELPNEVEKVIINQQGIFHENGLELQDIYTIMNEKGNLEIRGSLLGEQTEYDQNELNLVTNIQLGTTIILKKEMENKGAQIKLAYTNEHEMEKDKEEKSKELEIQLQTYEEEKGEEKEEEDIFYQEVKQEETSIEGLQLEVAPVKGDVNLSDGDILYEGEFIKYNIKLTNTSQEEITGVKIVGNVPEGTIYGKLEAEYFKVQGKYEYIYDESKTSHEIEIGSLKPGESITEFYEIRVKDLLEDETEKEIQSSIKANVGEIEVATFQMNHKAKKAEEKVLLTSFVDRLRDQWTYRIRMEKREVEEAKLTIKVPKELELIYISRGRSIIKYRRSGNDYRRD